MAKHYTQVAVTPTNEEWMSPYNEAVPPIVAKHGGRYLALTTDYERIEGNGDNPAILVIVEWPDRKSAQNFYDDPDYEPYRASRLAGADNQMLLLPGLES